jgi:hypothetical protein
VDTHLFQALTLGLLLIVIIVLLVVVSMLGKVRAALDTKGAAREPGVEADTSESTQAVDAQELESGSTQDTFAAFEMEESQDARTPQVAAEPAEEFAGVSAESSGATPAGATPAADEPDSERPYERGGRWYFRRSGELLVYEEGTGEWIPAPASEDTAEPGVSSYGERHAVQDAAAESTTPAQTQAEEVAASTEPAVADAGSVEQPRPSTSFGGQPVATVDGVDFQEPTPAESEAETAFGVSQAQEEETLAQQTESFWKCPSCGAVNGSTAATCRMCFTPRP